MRRPIRRLARDRARQDRRVLSVRSWTRRGSRQLDAAPIAADLAAIRDAKTKTDIAVLMGRAKRGFGQPVLRGVTEDDKDPTRNTLNASQAGLGLPDRDYYLSDAFKDKKAKYRDYIARMLEMVELARRAKSVPKTSSRSKPRSPRRAGAGPRAATATRPTTR